MGSASPGRGVRVTALTLRYAQVTANTDRATPTPSRNSARASCRSSCMKGPARTEPDPRRTLAYERLLRNSAPGSGSPGGSGGPSLQPGRVPPHTRSRTRREVITIVASRPGTEGRSRGLSPSRVKLRQRGGSRSRRRHRRRRARAARVRHRVRRGQRKKRGLGHWSGRVLLMGAAAAEGIRPSGGEGGTRTCGVGGLRRRVPSRCSG